MLSLSVNRWGFTDKLFKMNKLSVEGPFFRTNQNYQHQVLHQPHYVRSRREYNINQPPGGRDKLRVRIGPCTRSLSARPLHSYSPRFRCCTPTFTMPYLCLTHGTAAGNSRVSAGYYEFYYICLRWFFRTNEHISKAIKVLVTY